MYAVNSRLPCRHEQKHRDNPLQTLRVAYTILTHIYYSYFAAEKYTLGTAKQTRPHNVLVTALQKPSGRQNTVNPMSTQHLSSKGSDG